jgi:hypothetical protein
MYDAQGSICFYGIFFINFESAEPCSNFSSSSGEYFSVSSVCNSKLTERSKKNLLKGARF